MRNYAQLNLVPIGQAVAEIWRFFDFFYKMAVIRHLGIVIRVFGAPTKSLLAFRVCEFAKFGGIQCNSFDNMQVLILCALSFKCVFTPPNGMVFAPV